MPSLSLSSKWNNNGGLVVGRYALQPGVTYTDLDMRDESVLGAIQRGDLVFTDGTNLATFEASPIEQAEIKQFDADTGTNL